MMQKIEVVPYRDEWPDIFEAEATLIKRALGDNCLLVHHIGSTAVPGLAAKPIIDILPVVKNIFLVDEATSAMEQLGYEAKGESGMLFRRYFQKGGDIRTFNVHVYEEGNAEIERHVIFRDWMIAHPEDMLAYGELKCELALKHPNDIVRYCMGKDEFVSRIDAKTGFIGLRVVQALTDREWQAVHHLTQKFFFNRVSISDSYASCFQQDGHTHLVLYKGSDIVGYAHIESWPENQAVLRMLVVDDVYQNRGIGSEFLKICERWLKGRGVSALLLRSSADASQFFCKRAYIEMPFDDNEGNQVGKGDLMMGKIL